MQLQAILDLPQFDLWNQTDTIKFIWDESLWLFLNHVGADSCKVGSLTYSYLSSLNTCCCSGNMCSWYSLIYINDLPGTINQISSPTLFADDTNIICMHYNTNSLKEITEEIIMKINKWFQLNSLILNFNKAKIIQFTTKTNLGASIYINHEHKHIVNSQSTSFVSYFR